MSDITIVKALTGTTDTIWVFNVPCVGVYVPSTNANELKCIFQGDGAADLSNNVTFLESAVSLGTPTTGGILDFRLRALHGFTGVYALFDTPTAEISTELPT